MSDIMRLKSDCAAIRAGIQKNMDLIDRAINAPMTVNAGALCLAMDDIAALNRLLDEPVRVVAADHGQPAMERDGLAYLPGNRPEVQGKKPGDHVVVCERVKVVVDITDSGVFRLRDVGPAPVPFAEPVTDRVIKELDGWSA